MTRKSDIALELLAPARDYRHGKTAIDSGADAVYIGAPAFGARTAASASLDEIAELCRYAHIFGARVHVAMNTLLYDDELKRAENMAHDNTRHGLCHDEPAAHRATCLDTDGGAHTRQGTVLRKDRLLTRDIGTRIVIGGDKVHKSHHIGRLGVFRTRSYLRVSQRTVLHEPHCERT